MFKKLLASTIVGLIAIATYGQTIVSTSPQNKNVVLEEYTGIKCVYCPEGHAIAKAIQDANPDRVSLINIHQGSFAVPGTGEPDFRTPFGDAIVRQSYQGSGFGYPSGSINRHVFPGRSMASGGGTAMSRSYWAVSANETMAMPSYVNVALTASIDVDTNIMDIHVEAYYTGDSPESTNMLNVVLLQNNTRGPQTGGGQGNNYNHMHRLVDMVTGQWGEEITQTTAGTFYEKDFEYPILCNRNGIPVEIGDLEVVVFITETRQEIASGNRFIPTVTAVHANDASVRCIENIPTDCLGEAASFTPVVNIQNLGTNPLTSLNIEYSINGTSATFPWSGNIASLKSENVTLPEVNFTILANNTFEVSIPNDDNNANNVKTVEFESAPSGNGTLHLTIITDDKGNECRWNIRDSDNNLIIKGGPYTNNSSNFLRIDLPGADCYTFTLQDIGGNGGTVALLTDSNKKVLFETDGVFGASLVAKFASDGILSTNSSDLEGVKIYPNPAQDILNITNAENTSIQIYDVLGKLILSKDNISINEELNVSNFRTGTYFIKISNDQNVTTKKFVVNK